MAHWCKVPARASQYRTRQETRMIPFLSFCSLTLYLFSGNYYDFEYAAYCLLASECGLSHGRALTRYCKVCIRTHACQLPILKENQNSILAFDQFQRNTAGEMLRFIRLNLL